MSNSSLVTYTNISPYKHSSREHVIDKITVHHMAGKMTAKRCNEVLMDKKASCNYAIGYDCGVGLFVDEKDRSFCSSSIANDKRAITIEVSNSGGAPDWKVSDKVYNKLVDLCVDICKRNGIKKLVWTGDATGNLTVHQFFAATACPGPYLLGKMPQLANDVNARLETAKPLSSSPVRMKMGFASSGDVKKIEAMLKEKSIPFKTADGFVITDVPVSAGDQIGLVQLCSELVIPCVIYEEQQPVDDETRIAALEAQVAELEKKAAELEEMNSVLRETVTALNADNAKLETKIDNAQKALAE